MLTDDVQQAMFTAMKARRNDEAGALRLALSALRSAAIEARRELTDDEAVAVLQREVKNRHEAERIYREAGRADRADKEAFQAEVMGRFLPAALEPAELARVVEEAIGATGAAGPRELGKVMGRVMPLVRGRADGDQVRQMVLDRLQGQRG
jgi:uncharacterized protein YqeY